jgi:DNA-binding CsgD family transcriptional regulator
VGLFVIAAGAHADFAKSLGSKGFLRELSAYLKIGVDHDRIAVCEYVRNTPVSILASEGLDGGSPADAIARKYLSNHFRRACADDASGVAGAGVQVHFAEVMDMDAGIDISRPTSALLCGVAAILSRRADRSADSHLLVLLARGGEHGGFRSHEKHFLRRNAVEISALADRNYASEPPSSALDRWADHLMASSSALSQREAIVCAYALMGYSNEATALNLGLTANSIITYRRRAFAKLDISSHNELIPMLFFPRAAAEPLEGSAA